MSLFRYYAATTPCWPVILFAPASLYQLNFISSAGISIFTRESSYLANAVLSVCHRVDQSKAVQARITKFSPSAAWKAPVSGTIKLFHKFEGGHSERGC